MAYSAIAASIMKTFDCGISSVITIRTGGKGGNAEFLHTELMPEAGKRGYTPIYVSFKTQGATFPDESELRNRLHGLIQQGNRVLLCLDDFDYLATDGEPLSILYFLRTILDNNYKNIVGVCTGSDRQKLRRLFQFRASPFYKSAIFLDLPPIG